MLRVHKYDVELEYLKGKNNVIADALSRVSPMKPTQEDEDQLDLVPIHYLTSTLPATPTRLDETRSATSTDSALSQLKVYITNG